MAVPRLLTVVKLPPNAIHAVCSAGVSPRQPAARSLSLARAATWAGVLGCVGIARCRTYWPDEFLELVRAPTDPLCGTSSIFIRSSFRLWAVTPVFGIPPQPLVPVNAFFSHMLCSFRSMVEPARQPAAGRPAGRFQPPSRWRSGIGWRRAGGLVSRRWSTRGSSAEALAQPGPLAIFLTPGPDAGRWNGAKPRRRLSRRRTLFVLLSVVPIFRPS